MLTSAQYGLLLPRLLCAPPLQGSTAWATLQCSSSSSSSSMADQRRARCMQGVQYTLRITTTRYRWLAYPQVRALLMDVANSFRLA